MRFYLTFFLAFVASLQAAIIPTDRTPVDWSKAGVQATFAATAGVGNTSLSKYPNSNIPIRTAITSVMSYGAVADDSTDNAAAFAAAIAATPAGGVCYIPNGTYRTTGGLDMKNKVTVRGQSRDGVIIKLVSQWAGPKFCTYEGGFLSDFTPYSTAITAGATAGSTSITLPPGTDLSNLNSFGALQVGHNIMITELDDHTFVQPDQFVNARFSSDNMGDVQRNRGQTLCVSGFGGNDIDGRTVQFSPALYSDLLRTPRMSRSHWRGPCTGAGLESLTLYAMSSAVPEINVQFIDTQNCWMYDVKSSFASQNHVKMINALWCEVRKCWFNDAFYHVSGQDNELAVRFRSTANLIIDNAFERLHISILCDIGAAGNVIAYNYCFDEYDDYEQYGNRPMMFSICLSHGPHGQYNLVEGNYVQKIIADAFWGTSSHNTIFRNWVSGHGTSYGPYSTRTGLGTPTARYASQVYRKAIDLWLGSSKYSVVGNILGDPTFSADFFKIILPMDRHDNQSKIWELDYFDNSNGTDYEAGVDPGEGSHVGGTWDLTWDTDNWGPRPSATIIDHGNYDFFHNAQTWDAGIADHTIPKSLFMSDVQLAAFLGRGDAVFDLANAGTQTNLERANGLPAYVRRYASEAPGSAPTAPSSLTATTGSASVINLAWTDNASDETGYQVRRGTASGALTLLATTAANATSYSSTSLAASTHYWFDVRAVNASGNSSYTAEANATTSAPAAPTWAPPAIPTVGQEYPFAGRVWVFNGTGWIRK